MRAITISLVGNSTILKEVLNGVTKIYTSNSSRELEAVEGGIKILAHPETEILNNFVINIAELTNDGIDFTGVVTSEDLLTKLAQEKCFKDGGWLGVDESRQVTFIGGNKFDLHKHVDNNDPLNRLVLEVKDVVIGMWLNLYFVTLQWMDTLGDGDITNLANYDIIQKNDI